MKKGVKIPIDKPAHFKLEYLEADSDDESKKVEDIKIDKRTKKLLSISPIDADELKKLVDIVKGITTLPGLDDNSWNDQVINNIKKFFINLNNNILMIYFDKDKLTSELNFLSKPAWELSYFVRKPGEIVDMKTFYEKVLFGTSNNNVETNILKIMDTLYAPNLCRISTWPDNIL